MAQLRPVRWRIGRVVLAAGASRRFGAADKLLIEIGGVPLVVRTVAAVAAVARSGVDLPAVVVVVPDLAGPVATAVAHASGPRVQLVANPRHVDGMGTSVACGVAAVSAVEGVPDGVLVTPADMPGLTADLVGRLIDAFVAGDGALPVHCVRPDGVVTSPMVWPRRLFPALTALHGDRGARGLLDGAPADAVAVTAAEVHDIDTPDDVVGGER
jgi:molybdenum cofactor cytidylyltransferase